MVAGEEGRSGQYEGTAMSHDEASKVPQIIAFGNFIDKSIINICSIIKYFYIIEKARHFAVRAFSTRWQTVENGRRRGRAKRTVRGYGNEP